MLPPMHPSEDLISLRPQVEEFFRGEFENFTLAPEDISLVGSYVRTFTFIELNLHRAVRMFRESGYLSGKEARHPAACDLTKLVRKGAACIPLDSNQEHQLFIHLAKIEIGQPFRNLLAHWSCGRLPGTEAFLFVTMDERDAKAVGDNAPAFNGMYWAVVRRLDLHQLNRRMQVSGNWLAFQVAAWHSLLFEC